jgi:hypothetical protein
MEIPSLTPLDLRSDAFTASAKCWKIPNSNYAVCYTVFSGSAANELAVFNIKWRIREFCRVTRCKGIFVNLTNLNLAQAELRVDEIRAQPIGHFVRIAVSPDMEISYLPGSTSGEVSDDFAELTRGFLDYAESLQKPGKKKSLGPTMPFDEMSDVTLSISEIEARYYSGSISSSNRRVGLIQFRGYYRRGSEGAPDGMWIGWQIDEFCDYVRPFALIVDFSELDYEWGDDLFVQPLNAVRGPIRIVVRGDRMSTFKGVLNEGKLRENLHAAFEEIRDQVSA